MKIYDVCRCCENNNLIPWISLPDYPIANDLSYDPNYNKFSLKLNYCSSCGHLQLTSAPNLDNVFVNYKHKSAISNSAKNYFVEYSNDIFALYDAPGAVLDIGSNDGFLLQQFKNKKWIVYGVEPSKYLKRDHIENRIPIYTDFFSTKLVDNNEWRNYFDVICANNVLSQMPNIQDAMEGIVMALKPKGLLVVEFLHSNEVSSGRYLDNVHHEYIDYYTPYSFSTLCRSYGLVIENVEITRMQSFRAYVRKKEGNSELLPEYVDENAVQNISNLMAERKARLKQILGDRKFIVYGAAAEVVAALYTLDLVNEKLIGVVDDNELKQGCYFPGTNIMITQPEHMDKTSLVLITISNNYEDIERMLKERGHVGEILRI